MTPRCGLSPPGGGFPTARRPGGRSCDDSDRDRALHRRRLARGPPPRGRPRRLPLVPRRRARAATPTPPGTSPAPSSSTSTPTSPGDADPAAARPPPARRAGGIRRGDGGARDRRRRHRDRLRRRGRGDRGAAGLDAAGDRPRGGAARRRPRAPGAASSRRAPSSAPPPTFTARPWPAERLATIEEAVAAASAAAEPACAVLIDARPRDRFAGAPTRSTRAPATSPARARSPAARTSTPTAGCSPPTSSAPASRSTPPPTSSPTAAPASPPATTCSRWSRRGSARVASSPAPGRSGAATLPVRPKPAPPMRRRGRCDGPARGIGSWGGAPRVDDLCRGSRPRSANFSREEAR